MTRRTSTGVPIKNLIINADDLGLTSSVSKGIIHGANHGIVTSTSALMNTHHIQTDLPRTRQACPRLGIGVHLVITEGRPLLPLSQVSSLVDDHGDFFELHHQPERIHSLNLNEVRGEWKAQIESFIELGFPPDHLDSHHHISYFHSGLFQVLLSLAQEYKLPIRYPPPEFIDGLGETNIQRWLTEDGVKAPEACITSFYGADNAVSRENMLNIISTLGEGTNEVMCHPGYADRELIEGCSYSTPRELELEILTSREMEIAAKDQRVTLVSFSALA